MEKDQSSSSVLPEGHFTQVKFQDGGAGDAFFINASDPNLAYDHIQMLYDRVGSEDRDFESTYYIDADTRRVNAEIYNKIEIFRGTMQYLEEFGIYLDSYLRGDRSLATSLTDTTITDFYELYEAEDENENLDEYLAEHGATEDYDGRLREVFGY